MMILPSIQKILSPEKLQGTIYCNFAQNAALLCQNACGSLVEWTLVVWTHR